MKKYLLGLFAVVLAVFLCAFTSIEKKDDSKANFTDYYYYKLNAAGTQLAVELSSSTISRAAAQTAAGCNNTASAMCAYGYTYRITSLPVDIPGDFSDSFKKTN
ncbi:MAG: hypothetical protein ABI675_21510 [Chitinophagaceae bacterium]